MKALQAFLIIVLPSLVISHSSLVISPALAETLPQAQWAALGLPINDAPGNTIQEAPRACQTDGGQIVVWQDGRNGYLDIYAQKLDPAGQPLWTAQGQAVCSASGNQSFAQVSDDGNGGAIVVWQDFRDGNADIYAQRISSAGKALWGKDGLKICGAEAGQFSPQLVTDGNGGAIIAWHDYRSGGGEDIYAQRVGSAGDPLWEKNGVAVCLATGTQWHPQLTTDGSGGAVICWTDGRLSSANNNIYAQRLNASGQILWEKDGQPVCLAGGNQERAKITLVSDGFIVAWQDSRQNNPNLFAQKLSSAGRALWAEGGIAAARSNSKKLAFDLASDGQAGALLVWEDYTKTEPNICGQYLQSDGSRAWPEDGRAIGKSGSKQLNPLITRQENNRWLIIWENWANDQADLFYQQVNGNGMLFLPDSGQPLATAKENQTAAVACGNGSVTVFWQDSRQGGADIYAQKIGSENKPLWPREGVVVCNAAGSVLQQNVQALVTGNGEVIAVFEDSRSGYNNIYAQKVSTDGRLTWGAEGLAAAPAERQQEKAVLTSDGAGGVILAWEEKQSNQLTLVKAQRITNSGGRAWRDGLAVAQLNARQANPEIVGDQAGGAIVVWEDDRSELDETDLYGQRLSSQGQLLWGGKGQKIISGSGGQIESALTEDGYGGAVVAWTDYRRGDRNPNIYAQRLNASGKLLWPKDGAEVCAAPDIQRKPAIFGDGQGGAVIAWTDKGGGSYDIYAQRLNAQGESLWLRDGIPVSQMSRTQQNPLISGSNVLVWEDYRFGNWDIFATSVSPQGKLTWGGQGVPVVLMPYTQYAPQTLAWKNGSVVIAWEDYRNGNSYEIYSQKLNSNGEASWPDNGLLVKTRNGARSPKLAGSLTNNSLFILWEDFTNGGRAIYGQRYLLN